MKTKLALFMLMLLGFVAGMQPLSAQKSKKTNRERVIYGTVLHCGDCESKIMKNMAFEKGVVDLKTDLKSQTVTIDYRSDKTDKVKLAAAMKKLGFDVKELACAPETKGDKSGCCGGH